MVLDHVPNGACFFVVTAARTHAQLLGHGDLDMVDALAVPQPLPDRIGKPEGQDVLNCLLTQIMVDAEDLLLMGEAGQFQIQRLRCLQIMSEGLLHNDSLRSHTGLRLLQQSHRAQMAGHLAELAGIGGQVKQQITPQPLVGKPMD